MADLTTLLASTDKLIRNNILYTIKELREYIRYKSINEIIRAYRDELTNLAYDGFNGAKSSGEISRELKGMLRDYGHDIYVEGMREGGIDEDSLEDEDERIINEWVTNQKSFTLEFAKAITEVKKADDKELARNGIMTRVDYWVDNLNSLGNMGYASAKKDMMVTWKLGATEKHCATCSKLNGQRHRLSWFTSRDYIPQLRGSEELECGGWKCDCSLEDDKGNTVMP